MDHPLKTDQGWLRVNVQLYLVVDLAASSWTRLEQRSREPNVTRERNNSSYK